MSTIALATPWMAIRTRARAEKAVRDCLDSQDVEVFLPATVRTRKWSDRIKTIEWPLFPGYCFARFVDKSRLTILKTPGVAGIVSFGGEVALVPAVEINGLRTLVGAHLRTCGATAGRPLVIDPVPFLATGTLVQVTRGPLAGIVGRLIRQSTISDAGPRTQDRGPRTVKLVLSVEMIAQSVSVEVDASAVKSIDAGI